MKHSFKCDICGTEAKSFEGWKKHRQKYHRHLIQKRSKIGPENCQFCPWKGTKDALRKHVQKNHPETTNYKEPVGVLLCKYVII